MLRLPDAWVWDSWYVDDGTAFHAFALRASRALLDPERRHLRASVAHAVSPDLVDWTVLADALVPADAPAFDDQAIWTGSIVRANGRWHLFYTGIDRAGMSREQVTGHAVSEDLIAWERASSVPVAAADPRWYDVDPAWWRDPWVFRHDGRWHMLVTALSKDGPPDERGCIGHAVSDDLTAWEVKPPIVSGVGVRQLEVPQVVQAGEGWVLVFCLTGSDVHDPRLPGVTGTWTVPGDSPLGPFHFERAEPIDVQGNYAGRLVRDRDDAWCLMAFVDVTADGEFGGFLGDPVPLALTPRGTLQPSLPNATRAFRGDPTGGDPT